LHQYMLQQTYIFMKRENNTFSRIGKTLKIIKPCIIISILLISKFISLDNWLGRHCLWSSSRVFNLKNVKRSDRWRHFPIALNPHFIYEVTSKSRLWTYIILFLVKSLKYAENRDYGILQNASCFNKKAVETKMRTYRFL